MPQNPLESKKLPIELFGGADLEVAPPTLPQGLSPDNQDVAFVPGSVFTRPGAEKILDTGFGSLAVTYAKTFVQPDGNPLNLYLSSDGAMHVQDLGNPDDISTIFHATPGVFATSATAFGREYFAFHDGFVGKDIPRQYDGSNWYRVSQDGTVASGLAAADFSSTLDIDTIVPKPTVNIVSAVNNAAVITITTQTAHGLLVGDLVLVSGVTVFQYNGQATVTTIPSATTFTFDVGIGGWAIGTGGIVVPLAVTVTTVEAHDLIAGETIVISGDSNSNYNNSQSTVGLPIGLNPGGSADFYTYPHRDGGGFPYNHGNLPSKKATFNLKANQGITFNPANATTAFLPNAPLNSIANSPMKIFGVNATGAYDGTSESIWSGATENWGMAVTFNLTIPAAGTAFFRMIHDDGAIIGMGGGISAISGPSNNPWAQTVTAKNAYPVMAANNTSTDNANVDFFQTDFSVNVPAAGVYPVEIDYSNWEHGQMLILKFSVDNGATYNVVKPGALAFATPPAWTVLETTGPNTFVFDAVYASGTGAGGTIAVGGLIAPGTHQLCVSYLTETDYITKPCPPVSWTSAGNKRVQVTGLPIGPPNTKARVISFTGSGGGNFFNIPVPALDAITGQTISTSTVVNDNTSTSAVIDFADNTLFEASAIDITGNNLFAQVVIGPCAGIFSYSNRLFVWGDTNKVANLLNMGFEGGIASVGATLPLGWDTSESQAGALVTGDFGYGWQITGSGVAGVKQGLISQPAFTDYLHLPILTPGTQYTFECWTYASNDSMGGSFTAELFSESMGSLATASINANTLGVGSANGSFVRADFSAVMPSVIPSDTVLRIYATNLDNSRYVVVDEMMVVYTLAPISTGQLRVSYAINPEAFDGVTGLLDIEYSEAIMDCKILRDNLYILSDKHLCRTSDNGQGEPITWTNYTVSDRVGGLSTRCLDVGEADCFFASESGVYSFSGGTPQKISQEIQPVWDAIDSSLWNHIVVKNDTVNRRLYVAIPLTAYSPTGATFTPGSCNKLLVMDYREDNSAEAIQSASPMRISMTGRVLATDLGRKWTIWNLPSNCLSSLSLPDGLEPQMTFGSGNGLGLTGGFGNIYRFNPDKFTDDDYGLIGALNGESSLSYAQWVSAGAVGVWRPRAPYYITYFAPSHEQENMIDVGAERKVFEYIEAYVSGVGGFYVIPFRNNLKNPALRAPSARTLAEQQNFDLGWLINTVSERCAFLFYALPSTTPLPGIVSVTISPGSASISASGTQQFTDTCNGAADNSVTWSADHGTVSGTGLYTAPITNGTYHVTATSNADPTKHATATVTVTGGA